MEKIVIDDKNFIVYRKTPWDTNSFGFQTNEILEIVYDKKETLFTLIKEFDKKNKIENITFTYTRVDTNDKILKQAFFENKFYYAETTFALSKNDMESFNFFDGIKHRLELKTPNEDDYKEIQSIARDDFHYGRFHEDFNIEADKAKIRYNNWINDLVTQKKEFYIYKPKDNVLAFHSQEVHNDSAKLILTGTSNKGALISLSFWASFLDMLKNRGIKKATTMVSASNVKIVNLYSFFRFKFEKTLIGFHKIYNLRG